MSLFLDEGFWGQCKQALSRSYPHYEEQNNKEITLISVVLTTKYDTITSFNKAFLVTRNG